MFNKKLTYTTLFVSLCAAFAACSDDVLNGNNDPNDGKSPIELSIGGVTDMNRPITRAVTDPTSSMNPLPANTSIFMYMQSDFIDLGAPHTYGGTTSSKACKTLGVVDGDAGAVKFVNDATYTRTRYWDDAHARCSNISIWALACSGKSYIDESTYIYEGPDKFTPSNWTEGTQSSLGFTFYVQKNQNIATFNDYDVLFSNNIVNYTGSTDASIPDGSKTDRRLNFDTTNKKFKKGEMVFYHALSKITVKLNLDNGFTGTNDFQFVGGGGGVQNICLDNFNTRGKLNIQSGKFTDSDEHKLITGMKSHWDTPNTTDTSKPTYELEAYVIPYVSGETSKFDASKTDVYPIYFFINNNKYQISSQALFNAIKSKAANNIPSDATDIKLESGKHYIFTINISKSEISNISAQVAEWEEITADVGNLTNARVTIDIEDDRSDASSPNYAFYRLEHIEESIPTNADNVADYTWKTKYLSDTDHMCYLTHGMSGWSLTSDVAGENAVSWYWPDSKTFYHFRTVQPANASITENGTNGDYFTIHSTFEDDTQYDPRWGAPFKEINPTYADKLIYNKNTGFDVDRNDPENGITDNPHQIYKAIGATAQPIKIIPIHMMSQVTFNIKTSNGDDAVDLVDDDNNQTKVELLQFYKDATVRLGSGLVSVTGDKTNELTITQSSAPSTATGPATYFYSVVPQDLANVELRITTPDNNRYLVPLNNIVATSITNKELVNPYLNNKINYWYPNFKYTYTFTLTKKGITDLKATIVDWEEVTVDQGGITIQ